MVMDRTGPPDKSEGLVQTYGTAAGARLAVAAAATYDTSLSEPVDIKRRSSVGVVVDYEKSDETTMRFQVMVAKGQSAPAHGSGEWAVATELGDQSSGLRELFAGETKMTPASFPATWRGAVKVSVSEWDWVRVDFRAVGGAGTGKILCQIAGGWGM